MTVAYIAYIDESGDDGLSKVQPIDPNGASEWFVLGAVVVPVEMRREVIWVKRFYPHLSCRSAASCISNPLMLGDKLQRAKQ